MLYPDVFNYKLKSDPVYSFTPQGQLHVGKLIRNQPYWKKANLAAEEKKKSLVLADWTASGWSEERINEVTHVISKLLEAGFALYIWRNGEVEPLNKSNLFILENEKVREDMTPVTHEKIITTTMAQCKLTRDEVHVLDDYWLQAIMDQKFDQPRTLKMSDYSRSKQSQEDIICLQEKVTPKIKNILHDEFSYKSNLALYEIKHRIPEISIVTTYRSLDIMPREAYKLLADEEFTINGISIKLHELAEIEGLDLLSETTSSNTITLELLQDLLNRVDNLKSLDMAGCSITGDIVGNINVRSLETLNLRETTISAHILQQLLAKAENLKSLDLGGCKIIGDITESLNLKFLKKINLESVDLTTHSLQNLLANSENLKSMNLIKCAISGPVIESLNLKSMESLQLVATDVRIVSSVSAILYQMLLAKAENLKSLDFGSCRILGDMTEDLNLKSLETLTFSHCSEIREKSLRHLLANTDNLKNLDLIGIKILGDIANVLNLKLLENLHISDISAQNLQYLLANTDNLKHLRQKVNLGITFDGLNLKSLESLSLHGEIAAHTLQDLLVLAKSENLKSLSLAHCKISGDMTDDLNVDSVEYLNLYGATITAKSLQNILATATKLRSLNLCRCEISGDMTEDLSLKSLEVLDLTNMKTTANNLQHLLSKTQKLKSLDLYSCKISGDMTEKINLQSLETLTLVRSTLSSENLQRLLEDVDNLKTLDFGHYGDKIIPFSFTSNLNLKSLETLSFGLNTYHEMPAKSLQHLLANAENLKSLTLKVKNISGTFTEDLNLKSLESLLLQGEIAAHILQHLLAKSNNLKSLDLSNCVISGDMTEDLNLESLETLNIEYISAQNLQHLLANADNLKSLDIKRQIKGDMTENLDLRSLETLNFDNSANLSSKTIQHFLVNAKKLKSLDLKYNTVSDRPISFNEDLNLNALETLTLASDIPSKSLQHLLAQTANLKYLELKLNNISGDFTGILNLQSLEILKMPYGIDISPVSIQHILSQADNIKSLDLHCYTIRTCYEIFETLHFNSLETLNLGVRVDTTTDNLISLLLAAPNLKYLKLSDRGAIDFNDSKLKKILEDRNSKVTIEEVDKYGIEYKANNFPNYPDFNGENKIQLDDIFPPETSLFNNTIQNHLAPKQRRSNNEKQVDANTGNSKKEYQLNQLFCGQDGNPHPGDYRLAVYHRMRLNQDSVTINKAFTLDNHSGESELDINFQDTFIPESDLDLADKFANGKTSADSSLYYGKIDLILDNEWQALPSLSSIEKILEYHFDKPFVPCEIKYSARDNLYYIRATDNNSHAVKMDFLLETYNYKKIDLPEKLHNLINHYNIFGEGSHSFKGPGTGQQYLDAINQENKGSCRHRAIALMDAIQHHKADYDLPDTAVCRYVSNDCHAFVEIQLTPDSPWISHDLGGYDADLKIDESNMPNQLAAKTIQNVPNFKMIASPILKGREYYAHQFETWRKQKPQFHSPDAYCQRLACGLRKKQLIELSSTAHVQAMSLALETYCNRIHRPVFYIHSPDDLVCSAPYVEKKGDRGELEQGPGGALHDFLIRNQDKANPPVLIVNYDRFEADDIVRLNSLLDKVPMADGTPLPDCAVVVGLINPEKPGCYQGEDFYSRFGIGNVETCPFALDQLKSIKQMEEKTGLEGEIFAINLCHAQDWEERLLGRWVIKKDGLYFEQGLLAQALHSGLPIAIQNGLWDNESFCHFWDRARALGHIEFNDERFDISKSTFIKSEGYDWNNLKQNVMFDCNLKADSEILNPTRLSEFFHRYQCDNTTNKLDTLRGLIEEQHDNMLDVNLTRTLNEDEWGALLIECQKHHVILNCHCAPSVSLPKVLGELPDDMIASTATPIVIQSTDVDVTVSQITRNEVWKVIDVSELCHNDLLTNINGTVNKENEKPFFEFTQSDRVLKQALANHENVILKGRFSTELADALAPLLLNKQDGKLRLVMSDAEHFHYAGITRHEVNVEEKYAILEKRFPAEKIKSLNTLESEPLCKSFARLVSPQSDPWQGMHGISGGIRLQEFDGSNSKTKSDAFIRQRQDSVNAVLKDSPYVFLTGLTGVGKTTFVEKYLASETTQLYFGDARQKWAEDQSDKQKILFIDEANLTSKQWSEFEGLFDEPPGIVIDGTYYPLTKNHKVIFAGNPLNYGDERKMAPLFERHGNALVFEPMPQEFICEVILKPVFANTDIEKHSLAIAREILKTYRFLCECSNDEVVVSPRELQMMALLVLSHAKKNPHDDVAMVARHHAYLLAKNLVPGEKLAEFAKQFSDPMPKAFVKKQPAKFVLTPSREPLYQYLNDLLALREYRGSNKNIVDDDERNAKLYGGLGGIVIEGEPGIGKSELVVAHLRSHDYDEVYLTTENVPANSFYRMPISMQKEEKERLLLKAFHEGAVVIVDEINSAPMMERLLNDLLMGKAPNGDRPRNPGFMVIGTQNPVTMAGRRKPSNALKRRMATVELPPYPVHELETILVKRGVERKYAKDMIKAYENKKEQARREQLSPAPTVRDLINVADERIKAVGKIIENAIEESIISRKSTATKHVSRTIVHSPIPEEVQLSNEDKNMGIVNEIDIAESNWQQQLNDLNANYSNMKNEYNKPNSVQTFFGMHNTLTWQFKAGDSRVAAWNQLKEILRKTDSDDEKLEIVRYAIKLDLFKEHRSNYAMTKYTQHTYTVMVLNELMGEIKEHNKLQANTNEQFNDRFKIYKNR